MRPAHNATRPDWTCDTCRNPWPCATRRQWLVTSFRGSTVSLNMFLVNHLVLACADQAERPAGEIYAQIVGWTRSYRFVQPASPAGPRRRNQRLR
jgi:hypothetical protein